MHIHCTAVSTGILWVLQGRLVPLPAKTCLWPLGRKVPVPHEGPDSAIDSYSTHWSDKIQQPLTGHDRAMGSDFHPNSWSPQTLSLTVSVPMWIKNKVVLLFKFPRDSRICTSVSNDWRIFVIRRYMKFTNLFLYVIKIYGVVCSDNWLLDTIEEHLPIKINVCISKAPNKSKKWKKWHLNTFLRCTEKCRAGVVLRDRARNGMF